MYVRNCINNTTVESVGRWGHHWGFKLLLQRLGVPLLLKSPFLLPLVSGLPEWLSLVWAFTFSETAAIYCCDGLEKGLWGLGQVSFLSTRRITTTPRTLFPSVLRGCRAFTHASSSPIECASAIFALLMPCSLLASLNFSLETICMAEVRRVLLPSILYEIRKQTWEVFTKKNVCT